MLRWGDLNLKYMRTGLEKKNWRGGFRLKVRYELMQLNLIIDFV